MKEVCIPLDRINEADRTELEVKDSKNNRVQRYRIESVDMTGTGDSDRASQDRFSKLQLYISNYTRNWELIQILDSGEGAKYIHLLYRKRN